MNYIEQLIKIYTDSRNRLIEDLRKRILSGQGTRYQQDAIRMIDIELYKLNKATDKWSWDAVSGSYTNGAKGAYNAIPHSTPFSAFGGIHRRAIDVIARNTQHFLTLKNDLIGRHSVGVIRDIGLEATAAKYAENLTGRETRKLIEKKLIESNFFSVPNIDNTRVMRVDSYAELVARTTTAEATNVGTINQMDAMKQYLVKMTEHNTTCKVCAVYQGRVYRTAEFPDPEDPRNMFPHISTAIKRYPHYVTIHPNCKHRLLPYVWEQKTPEQKQKDLYKTQDPLHGDPRGEAERKRYDDAQRKNRERMRDRKQWERYKSTLGDKVPSFSGFRAMKRHNSQRWVDLQQEYIKSIKPNVKSVIPRDYIKTKRTYTFVRSTIPHDLPKEEFDSFSKSIKESVEKAPENLQKVYRMYVPDGGGVDDGKHKGTAYYSGFTKSIKMDLAKKVDKTINAVTTWFHEHGHYIDHKLGVGGRYLSDNEEFAKALRADFSKEIKSFRQAIMSVRRRNVTLSEAQKEYGFRMISSENHAISDLYGGLSGNRARGVYGHPTSYWKSKPENITCEAFAHMFQAHFSQNEVELQLLEYHFPTALQVFLKLIGGV